jgi:Na+/proline symporter
VQNEQYLAVLLQWLIFFGLLSVWILPAFLFRNFAKRNNRKGWVYFIIGLAVGFVGLSLGSLMLRVLTPFLPPTETSPYFILVIFLIGYSFNFLAFQILKSRIRPKGGSNGRDGPQLYPKDEVI